MWHCRWSCVPIQGRGTSLGSGAHCDWRRVTATVSDFSFCPVLKSHQTDTEALNLYKHTYLSPLGRYHADEIVQDEREDCYLASFHVMDVSNQDSRPYYLVVENDRGTDKHPIHLVVDDPVEMGYVFGIVGGCIAALLLLICLLIYALRKKNCCFKREFCGIRWVMFRNNF